MQLHNYGNLGNYIVPEDVRGGMCVDIGGNTGCFSLSYKDFFSKIHIYEPQSECNEIIRQRTVGLQNITVFNEAVFSETGHVISMISHSNLDSGSVALKADNLTNNLMSTGWTDNTVDYQVKTITLEDILERAGGSIDYLKVDCETSEYNFLMNKDLKNIKYIGIELHCQLGYDKYNELLTHISKYFDLVPPGDSSYNPTSHKEVLFRSKSLTTQIPYAVQYALPPTPEPIVSRHTESSYARTESVPHMIRSDKYSLSDSLQQAFRSSYRTQ